MARFKPVHHIKGIFNLVVFLALIECLLTAGRVSAGSREIQYIFMGDKYYGSLAGAETMAGLQRSLYFMEEKFIPPVIWEESNRNRRRYRLLSYSPELDRTRNTGKRKNPHR